MAGAPPNIQRMGLIAGGGSFPFAVARAARRQGMDVYCIGIKLEASSDLADEVKVFHPLGLLSLNGYMRFFRKHNVKYVSWAGWIRKENVLTFRGLLSHLPDLRFLRFWLKIRRIDRQSQTLLTALANEFEGEGFKITDSTHLCPELLVGAGVLSRRQPSKRHLEDIAFGWKIAKRMADLDVGQSVAVYDKATIAVEGIEGTDRNILRAGELCKGGFTVVKLAMDRHDMRFDVPAVGPRTIESVAQAGGAVLAIEAGKTILLERERSLELANRAGIVVIALGGPPAV